MEILVVALAVMVAITSFVMARFATAVAKALKAQGELNETQSKLNEHLARSAQFAHEQENG